MQDIDNPTSAAQQFMYRARCKNPQPHTQITDVCTNCGRALDKHHTKVQPLYDGHREALWAWFLRVGAIPSYHGLYMDQRTIEVRQHIAECVIDWEHTTDPLAGTLAEFRGTESGNGQVQAVVGTLYCLCGAIVDQNWVIKGATLSEVIFGALNEADQATREKGDTET